MRKITKLVCLTAVLLIGALVMTSCGGEKALDEKNMLEISNAAGKDIVSITAVKADDNEKTIDLAGEVADGESINVEPSAEDGEYFIEIKFADSDFVYKSKEVSFDAMTKLELSAKDGEVVLNVFYGEEKKNIYIEQPAPVEEEAQEEETAQPQQAPAAQSPAPQAPAPQPSAPANPPEQSQPQQDGCLNDALFN